MNRLPLEQYFKQLFGVLIPDVIKDITNLLNVGNDEDLVTWGELVTVKRPNIVDNVLLYDFIKKSLRSSPVFNSNMFHPDLVRLQLQAFQTSYESILRKSFTVLFEATKKQFEKSKWYDQSFQQRAINYDTSEIIHFINDCLNQDSKTNKSLEALKVVVCKLHASKLNKIRNAVAHNVYVVEGDTEANSRVCYSLSDRRPYFRKEEYQWMKTADFLKTMDMVEIFHDLFLRSLSASAGSSSKILISLCQICGLQMMALLSSIQTKACYFCGEVGKIDPTPKPLPTDHSILP